MRLVRASRRPGVPAWAVAVLAVWAAVVVAFVLLEKTSGQAASLCLFREATGVPCATCGSTRAVFAASRGDVGSALAFNPLVVTGLTLAAAWLVLRVGFGRAIRLDLGRRQRRVAWAVVAIAFAANWAYVIWYHVRDAAQ